MGVMRIFGFEGYGGPEVQGFHQVPEPVTDEATVRIEVVAAGVNPADVKVRSGARQQGFPVVLPMAMGREACGDVLELGPGAPAGIAVGDRVFGSCAPGTGAIGEQTLLTAASTVRVPDGLDPTRAACIPVAVGTAHDAVSELECGTGDTVLVLGAGGGVGIHAVQLARRTGARVIGVASAAKRDFVERLGAVHVASGNGWEERVQGQLEGDGRGDRARRQIDAMLDCVGGDVLTGGLALLTGTRVRSIADPDGTSAAGGVRVTRRRTAEVFARLAETAARGDIEIVLDEAVPFDEAARAIARVEQGHARGKTVIAFT